ncbi:MAG TPA: hypothetical protein VNM24_09210 [Burkholderiales bacterium]|jgi:hypothetical protein|nr:hypothetical protein [Burkholderiales bacterium]
MDSRRIADFSVGVFSLVPPSLLLFLALPALLRALLESRPPCAAHRGGLSGDDLDARPL